MDKQESEKKKESKPRLARVMDEHRLKPNQFSILIFLRLLKFWDVLDHKDNVLK